MEAISLGVFLRDGFRGRSTRAAPLASSLNYRGAVDSFEVGCTRQVAVGFWGR